MDFQAFASQASQIIVALVAAGGGLAAMGYGLFKFFGSKWLESKFAERLQNLKAEQDQAIRYVQSTIDREIHRAKKLYDSEFTALSECWALLREAYDQSASTIASFTAQVERMNDEELERHLVNLEMDESERKDIKRLEGKARHNAYYRWTEWERYKKVDKSRREFRGHLDTNSIFFADGFTEKFRELDNLIGTSNVEYRFRVLEYGSEGAGSARFDATGKLHDQGALLMRELEELVRKRLWSVASDGKPQLVKAS